MADPLLSNVGSFVPTTNVWDVQRLSSIDVNSDEFKELLVRLYQNLNKMALVLNTKQTGYYPLTEFVTSGLLFPNPALNQNSLPGSAYRQIFRTEINFGPLPNATTISIPHNISIVTGGSPSTYSFVAISGAASKPDQTKFIPLPYSSSTLANNIELYVTNTNVVITTAIDYSSYTTTLITLDYVKS